MQISHYLPHWTFRTLSFIIAHARQSKSPVEVVIRDSGGNIQKDDFVSSHSRKSL